MERVDRRALHAVLTDALAEVGRASREVAERAPGLGFARDCLERASALVYRACSELDDGTPVKGVPASPPRGTGPGAGGGRG